MAGYVSIQTIVPCSDEETFHDIVQRYLQALVSLGIAEPALLSWGQGLQWPMPDEQIVTEWPSMRGEVDEESFEIKLMFILWGNNERREKVSLELLVDIEEAIGSGAPFDPKLICYKQAFGSLAWRMMQGISAQVLGYGSYLADEATDCDILKLLDGEHGHFWSQDLAIAPREFYERYLPVSEHTVVKRQDEIGIFALREHWDMLPWEE
jgi:hypothetical protein